MVKKSLNHVREFPASLPGGLLPHVLTCETCRHTIAEGFWSTRALVDEWLASESADFFLRCVWARGWEPGLCWTERTVTP